MKPLFFWCFWSLSVLVLTPVHRTLAANSQIPGDDLDSSLPESLTQSLPPQDLRPPIPKAPTAPEIPPQPPTESPLQLPQVQPPTTPEVVPSPSSDTITVKQFIFLGNTVFSQERLEQELREKNYLNRPLSFAELLQARSVLNDLYLKNGYITSGAYIPDGQQLQGEAAVVKIQIIEGSIEKIQVTGTKRLNPNYVRSRLALGASQPLNQQRLLDALKLLQVNPLIKNISAELLAGSRPGQNVLEIQVQEADTLSSQISLNNGRSPSVGSDRRRTSLSQANLLGLGDSLSIGYTNTDGSNGLDTSYTIPISPRNATLSFSYGTTSSIVIESPFEPLEINSNSRYYELTLRQPVIQTPTQELALGITASRTESETSLKGIPFPLSPGADDQGRTKISALRFFQEWTQQNPRQVIAFRSQFSLGIDAFNANINNNAPDSRFFAWRGQGQWVRLLSSSTGNPPLAPTVLVRAELQLADRPLVSSEQFGIGGLSSVRGYRQDTLLTDNGTLASAEIRLPILRVPEWQTSVQLIPFVDIGTGWNSSNKKSPNPNTIAGVGLGLQLLQSNRFSARLDWGIPLTSVSSTKKTWQENGIYFSVQFNPF